MTTKWTYPDAFDLGMFLAVRAATRPRGVESRVGKQRSPRNAARAKFVYDFTEGNKDLKDLLGGKGANLAEMTNLGLPVPPGFTITTEACKVYLDSGAEPAALRDEVSAHLDALEQKMGKKLGQADDPLLVSVRSGAKFSMPGMMDTVLNIGLSDESVAGPRRAGRRRALRLGLLPPPHPDVRQDRARRRRRALRGGARGGQAGQGRHASTSTWTPPTCKKLVEQFKKIVAERDRPRLPAGPARADGPRHHARSSTPGTPTAPSSTAARSASPATSAPRSTSARWSSATSAPTPAPASPSPATPPPATRASTATTCRTPRARTSSPASATPCRSPSWSSIDKASYDQLMQIMETLENALQGPVRHRVHHRARQAVDAPDPGRQAHRRRRLPHRHPARRPGPDRRGRGAAAGQRRPARAADVPALRRRTPKAAADRPRASPPRRARRSARPSSTRTPPSSGRAPARRSSWSAARPTPTTCDGMIAAEGILTSRGGKTSHAAVVARGMGKTCVCGAEELEVDTKRRRMTAPDGHGRRGGRRRLHRRLHRQGLPRRGAGRAVPGRRVLRGPDARRRRRRRRAGRGRAPDHGVRGPRAPAAGAGQRRQRRGRRRAPAASAPRASACAAPSTCSSASAASWSSG